jgi:hypothetical protein
MDFTDQFLKNFPGIADDRNIGLDNLADFRRININMRDFGLCGKLLALTGDPVVKAHPNTNQQVAFGQRQIGRHCAVHSGHTKKSGIIDRHRAQSHQSNHDRNVSFMSKANKSSEALAEIIPPR